MPNNTETYWTANGESLHTYARSIETLGGNSPPPLRGGNIVVPLHPGARHVAKTPDSNTYSLGMWLRGVAQDAGAGAVAATKAQYMKNYNDLVRLLWRGGKEFQLTKRFYDITSAAVISATAQAAYASGMEPTMIGQAAGRCIVDLTLADPFFYDDALFTTNLVNGNNVIVIPGNAPTLNMFLTITGSRTNTTIRNLTNGIEFTCPEIVLAGDYVEINPRTYDATFQPASGVGYDVSSRIIHAGSYQWMQLEPGTNVIQLSSTSGIGVVSLQARGAWV